jgi:hypothetical protein
MWDFVMDKSGAGAGFLRELRFPLQIYIPSASPQSSSFITRGWHNRLGVAAVPIASQSRIKKKKKLSILVFVMLAELLGVFVILMLSRRI